MIGLKNNQMSNGGKREGAGRKKGVPNKQTTAVKQCIINAFEQMGGVGNLVIWAKQNETEFYKLWGKMIPHEVTGEDGGDINVTITKVVHSARDTD